MGRYTFRLAVVCLLLLLASCRSSKVEHNKTERFADTLVAISVRDKSSRHVNTVFVKDTIEIHDSVCIVVNEVGDIKEKKRKSNERNVRVVEKEVKDTVIVKDTVYVDKEKIVYIMDEKEKKKNELSRNFMLGAGIAFVVLCILLPLLTRNK